MADPVVKKDKAYIGIDAGGVLLHKSRGEHVPVNQVQSRNPIIGALAPLIKMKENGNKLILISFASRQLAKLNASDIEKNYPGVFDAMFFVKDKMEKVALCRYLGIDVMIDDTVDVHVNIKNGLYVGKNKEIKAIPTMKHILFTGDCIDGENKDNFTEVDDWSKIYELLNTVDHTHEADKSIKLTKYVYPEYSSMNWT
jgi:hypothetical protein